MIAQFVPVLGGSWGPMWACCGVLRVVHFDWPINKSVYLILSGNIFLARAIFSCIILNANQYYIIVSQTNNAVRGVVVLFNVTFVNCASYTFRLITNFSFAVSFFSPTFHLPLLPLL